MEKNLLYYGDNLDVLRRYVKDESVDLVYLDPPFNSNASYNILFKEHSGKRAAAQIKAFEDTWRWDQAAAEAFEDMISQGGKVAEVMRAFHIFLGASDMMAYLSMMAPRLVELHRVLKPTGSIYLHCDPTASHYIKILMDAIFGPELFLNEIIWKRTSGHSDARRYGRVHDVILFFARGEQLVWNQGYQDYDQGYIDQYYRYSDPDGRLFMSGDLGAAGLQGGGYDFEWKGVRRVWRVPRETMEKLDADGRIFYTRNGIPRIKRYLDEAKGMPTQDIWADIEPLRSWHGERLGYPTQKPEDLLERIILSGSNEGNVVLDPFCGCGTTIAAAQKLNRHWIGIDITHLAISLIRTRLRDTYGDLIEKTFQVIGEPVSVEDATELAQQDPYQFQWWALGLVGARPAQVKKGADKGIDGHLYFLEQERTQKTNQIIFSVKAGKTTSSHLRDLRGVLDREQAAIGVLISMEEPTRQMRTEVATAGFYESPWGKHPRLQILTIQELLEGKKVDGPPSRQVSVTFKKAPEAKVPAKKKEKGLFE